MSPGRVSALLTYTIWSAGSPARMEERARDILRRSVGGAAIVPVMEICDQCYGNNSAVGPAEMASWHAATRLAEWVMQGEENAPFIEAPPSAVSEA